MTTLRPCVAYCSTGLSHLGSPAVVCSHRQDRHGELFLAEPLEMETILRKGSKATDVGIQMQSHAASLVL